MQTSLNEIWKASIDDIKKITGDLDNIFTPKAINNAIRRYNVSEDVAISEGYDRMELLILYRMYIVERYMENKQLDYLSMYFLINGRHIFNKYVHVNDINEMLRNIGFMELTSNSLRLNY